MTEMNPNKSLQEAFDDCVNRLQSGQSLEDCLGIYPHMENELRPMLEVIRLTRLAMPSNREITTARHRGANRLRETLIHSPHFRQRRSPLVWLSQMAAVLLLFAVVSGSGAWLAAQGSLPGERLYGLKQLTEEIRLELSSNDTELLEYFYERRIEEVQELIQRGQEAAVVFAGIWEAQTDTQWIVSGVLLDITPDTQIEAGLTLHDQIEVHARTTSDGRVIASVIFKENPIDEQAGDLFMPTPSATHTSSPTTTETATITTSLEPSSTATITATTTPTATSTATPTATRTASSTRTTTPTATTTRPPTQTPIPTATTCTAERPDGWEDYRVQSGDTLSQIALRAGTTTTRLMQVNCLTNANLLIVGTRLYVPDLGDDNSWSFATEESDDNRGSDSSNSGNDDRRDDDTPEPNDDHDRRDDDTPEPDDDDRRDDDDTPEPDDDDDRSGSNSGRG